MAKFTYKDKLIVAVWEMNRAAGLHVGNIINSLIDIQTDNDGFLTNEVHLAFALNAPCKIVYNGAVLEDGTHHLDIGEEGFDLTLPLTREGFEALPVSLTVQWVEAAELENEWLSSHFLAILNRILTLKSVPSSDVAAS